MKEIELISVLLLIYLSKQPGRSAHGLLLPEDDYCMISSRFIDYNFYFDSGSHVLADSMSCAASAIINETAALLEASVIQCANPRYRPRRLGAKQISWKEVEDKSISPTKDDDPKRTKPKRRDDVNGSFIVHKYFGLALLLPDHPFSSDMSRALVTVGTLYPMVSFSVGNGYEFNDLCIQYGVTSFPKLLFFKNGLLLGTYKGAHDVGSLAAQVSKWTKMLPQAVPLGKNLLHPQIQEYFEPRPNLALVLEPICLKYPGGNQVTFTHITYIFSAIYMFARLFIVFLKFD